MADTIVITGSNNDIPVNGFKVEYRVKDSGSAYTTLSPNPTTLPINISVDTLDVNYEVRVTGLCAFGNSDTVTYYTDTDFTKIWVKDQWYCETTTPFTITSTYTNYWSPSSIGFIDGNLYVVDRDATNKIYYAAPSELTPTGAVKHDITGTTQGTVYVSAIDVDNKKVYYTGLNTTAAGHTTGGLVYCDLSSGSAVVGEIPFGTDVAFNKLSLAVLKTKIMSVDNKVSTNNVLLVNRTNINDYSVKSYAQVGSNNTSGSSVSVSTLLANELGIFEDNRGDIIVKSNASQTTSYLSIYSNDLTQLKQVVNLATAPFNTVVGPSSKFRASEIYDSVNDCLFIFDYGSARLFKYGYSASSGKYDLVSTAGNADGYYQYPTYGTSKWFVGNLAFDPITSDLWLSGYLQTSENSSSIVAGSNRAYRINKQTLQPEYILVKQSLYELSRQGTTNTLWATDLGVSYTSATDGSLLKIER